MKSRLLHLVIVIMVTVTTWGLLLRIRDTVQDGMMPRLHGDMTKTGNTATTGVVRNSP